MWNHFKELFSRKVARGRAPVPLDIAPYERPLARVLNEAEGAPYQPIENLEAARECHDAHVVMEGDWGGQIYLTAPVSLVHCGMAELESLLRELDAFAWKGNGGEGCGVFFETHQDGEGISGGMGGGAAIGELWLHPELVQAGLETRVRDLLFGQAGT